MTLRIPRALVFTFAFPLVLIVLFNALNGNADGAAPCGGGDVRFAQFYTPSIGVFSLTTACYTTLIIGIATARDDRAAQARARHAAADADLPRRRG